MGKVICSIKNNLGGIGGSLAAETVSRRPIRTAPAVYEIGADQYVALQGAGADCPVGNRLARCYLPGGHATDCHPLPPPWIGVSLVVTIGEPAPVRPPHHAVLKGGRSPARIFKTVS